MVRPRPAAIRPSAPRTCATVTSAPADSADQPRSAISHTRVNVHTTHCGTTSSTDTAWMRHSTDDPRYGLARCSAGASARGGRGGSSTPTALTSAATAHTTAGNSSAAPTPCALGQPRNHQCAERHPERLGGLADAHHQAALLRREPADHQPAAGRIAAGSRHSAEQQERTHQHQRVHTRPPRTPPRPSARSRRASTKRSPTPIHHITPGDQGDSTMPKLGIADTRPALARSRPIVRVQGGNQKGGAVDEDVRRQRRRTTRSPASTSAARC